MDVQKIISCVKLDKIRVKLRKSKRGLGIKYHKPLTELNEEVAELWGLHAGDGSLTKNRWEFASHINNVTLINRAVSLIRRVVGVEPTIDDRPSINKTQIRSGQRQAIKYFASYFPFGKKSYIVEMPKEVMESNDPKVIKGALLGLFSSDGSFSFKRSKKLTPRLEFRVKSKKLRDQFITLAEKLNFKLNQSDPKHWNGRIYTTYKEKIDVVLRWMKEIGTNCDTHIKNFKLWVKLKFAGVPESGKRARFRS